jgi:hypothetical protein
VDYHDGTTAEGKLKGSIYCDGYYAQEFSEDDITVHGEPGVKLVPWSYRKRTWWFKCSDDEQRKEWLKAFQAACWKAKSPRDEDECIAKAFDHTIRVLRWNYWLWTWYGESGPEPERLGEFLLDLLDREVLGEILNNLPDNPAKQMTIDLVHKTVGGSVKAACSSAWLSAAQSVRSLSSSIQSSVKDLIKPLVEKEKVFKDTISEKISSKVDPFLADKGASLLKPVLDVLFKPVTEAFVYGVQGFHDHITGKITDGELKKENFDLKIQYVDWQLDWWNGPVHKAYVIVDRLYDTDLNTVASLFSGITSYTIYNMVMDNLKSIVHRALYTFRVLAKDIPETEFASVLAHVTSLMFHDAALMVKYVILTVLSAILSSPVNELVIKPCTELIAPLQATIDEIPIPGT